MRSLLINYQSILLISISSILPTIISTGCSSADIAMVPARISNTTGAVEVDFHLGKVGILAKRTTIEMKQLIVNIGIKGRDSVLITDTSTLSGSNETIVSKVFPELIAPEEFTLSVVTIDAVGKVIHSGTINFSTIPADTVAVPIILDALFSMMKVSFDGIPDSVSAIRLIIDAADTVDSAFTVGSRDTVKLEYDYLNADTNGVAHTISLQALGSFYGTASVLYSADTTIVTTSGVDNNYLVVLHWVGPGIPPGSVKPGITVGKVGKATIIATFE